MYSIDKYLKHKNNISYENRIRISLHIYLSEIRIPTYSSTIFLETIFRPQTTTTQQNNLISLSHKHSNAKKRRPSVHSWTYKEGDAIRAATICVYIYIYSHPPIRETKARPVHSRSRGIGMRTSARAAEKKSRREITFRPRGG